MSLFSWFSDANPTEAQVRAEIWSLGTRHLGWPLEGALEELQSATLTPARTVLLRACVKTLRKA